MVSKGFLPAWTDANEIWPGVCQSCVITTFAKLFEMRLITGTTCSPSLTARLPPGRKQFWTSMTRSADASSGLIEAAAQSCFETTGMIAIAPRPARIRLRSNMLHLPERTRASKSPHCGSVKKVACRREIESSAAGADSGKVESALAQENTCEHRGPGSARLNSVAHGAEACECRRPLVARRASDDAQRIGAAESQPLHHGDGGIVLAAGRIDTRFIAGLAVDADRLGHRNPRVAHPGDGGRGAVR